MPTSELGNPAHRKIDIEAFMPGEGIYGEVFQIWEHFCFHSKCNGFIEKNRRIAASSSDCCLVYPVVDFEYVELHRLPGGSPQHSLEAER